MEHCTPTFKNFGWPKTFDFSKNFRRRFSLKNFMCQPSNALAQSYNKTGSEHMHLSKKIRQQFLNKYTRWKKIWHVKFGALHFSQADLHSWLRASRIVIKEIIRNINKEICHWGFKDNPSSKFEQSRACVCKYLPTRIFSQIIPKCKA